MSPEEQKTINEAKQLKEQYEKLMTEVSNLRQYKIDAERKIAAMDSQLKSLEGVSNKFETLKEEKEELHKMYNRLQIELKCIEEDKTGIERGILNLIKKLGEESKSS